MYSDLASATTAMKYDTRQQTILLEAMQYEEQANLYRSGGHLGKFSLLANIQHLSLVPSHSKLFEQTPIFQMGLNGPGNEATQHTAVDTFTQSCQKQCSMRNRPRLYQKKKNWWPPPKVLCWLTYIPSAYCSTFFYRISHIKGKQCSHNSYWQLWWRTGNGASSGWLGKHYSRTKQVQNM